jgi:thiamine-monophosphate kinase
MATLTERRLVSWLGERFAAAAPEVRVGIGDDAAVLSPAAEPAIVSVDASVDGVHFDRAYLGYEDIGYRAFQAAISDLAAMGAVPTAALSALILPRALPRTAVDELTAGQARASRETACPVVGGNISRGGELSITTTVLGRAAAPLCRSGARPGHALWLVGEVGLAAAGLALLRITRARPTRLAPAGPSRGRDGREAALARCVEAWRRPRARLEEGRALVGRASAAIDVSDGLAADARQLATASGVRIVVDQEQLRAVLHPALLIAQRALRSSALRWALCGGEDYALLATGPAALRPACAVTIGYVARGSGAFLARSGRRVPLEGGFDHLGH